MTQLQTPPNNSSNVNAAKSSPTCHYAVSTQDAHLLRTSHSEYRNTLQGSCTLRGYVATNSRQESLPTCLYDLKQKLQVWTHACDASPKLLIQVYDVWYVQVEEIGQAEL